MTRHWVVQDSSISPLPGFDPRWFPDLAYRYLSIRRYINQSYSIETGPYVGSIPLNNGDTFSISPRCGQESLARMLFKTERLSDSLQHDFTALTQLSATDENPISWLSMLREGFRNSLRQIEISGSTSDRRKTTNLRATPKGSLHLLRTTRNIQKKIQQPFVSTFSYKTHDTPERNVLSSAAAVLSGIEDAEDNTTLIYRRWARSANWSSLPHDLDTVSKRLNSGHFSGGRNYYNRALVMAKVILLQAGVALPNQDVMDTLPFMTNVNDLFELYIRILFREHFANTGHTVEKGDGSITFFNDGTLPLKPDIVVSDGSGPIIIADVKYKTHPTLPAADFYQLSAYMRSMGCNLGILLKPSSSEGQDRLTRKVLENNAIIFVVSLNMQDWSSVETNLVDAISQALEQIA